MYTHKCTWVINFLWCTMYMECPGHTHLTRINKYCSYELIVSQTVSGCCYMYASEVSNVRHMRMTVVQFVLRIQNLTGYVYYAITDKPSRLNRLNTWQHVHCMFEFCGVTRQVVILRGWCIVHHPQRITVHQCVYRSAGNSNLSHHNWRISAIANRELHIV